MAKVNLSLQKRLAAKVAKVGLDRIAFDQAKLSDIKEAITKADIRTLFKEGAIKIKPPKKTSRHRARARAAKRKKGRQRGEGKRKGTWFARNPKKRLWINTIRPQRALLKYLLEKGKITQKNYRLAYAKAKGGEFRSKSHLLFYLRRNNLIKE